MREGIKQKDKWPLCEGFFLICKKKTEFKINKPHKIEIPPLYNRIKISSWRFKPPHKPLYLICFNPFLFF